MLVAVNMNLRRVRMAVIKPHMNWTEDVARTWAPNARATALYISSYPSVHALMKNRVVSGYRAMSSVKPPAASAYMRER